jgi:membrane associated rhomboid family serine protease
MPKSNDRRASSTPIPWLSAALLLAMVAFSIDARLRFEEVARAGTTALDTARDYLLAHPYLEPGPALIAKVDADVVARARAEYEQRPIPTPPGVVRRQQERLDEQVAAAIAKVGALPARAVAFVPGRSPSHTWVSHVLLHPNNVVLIGNGLLLLFFGLYLQRSLGLAGYGALIVLLILAGAAGWMVAAPRDAGHGLVGSTPLLAGLLAAFAVRFARCRSEGFYFVGLLIGLLWVALPPWATAMWSFAALELINNGPPPAPTSVYVPYLAAMLAGGIACGLAWLAGVDGDQRPSESSAATRDPRVRSAMRAREAGRPREALELLSEHLAAQPDAYEAAVMAWELATELGRDSEISVSLLRVIRIELRRGHAAAAIDHWLELVRGGIPERTEASLLIHIALLLREHDQKAEAVRALRFALEHSDERENHVIAMKIARAARGLDPGTSETAAWRALGSIELSLKDRQGLENLIGEILSTPAARAAWLARAGEIAAVQPQVRPAPAPQPPQVTEVDLEPAAANARPAEIEIETNDRVLDAVLAVPLELAEAGVEIQTQQGQKKLVRYERIEAVAVAVIRMRGDQFDPRRVLEGQGSAADSLRVFVKTVIERSNAIPLPDLEAALGRPFVSFDDLALYQRAVLLVEGPTRSIS